MTSELWTLPGPSRFAREVRSTLERGYSVVVFAPRTQLVDRGWREGLLDAIDRHMDIIKDDDLDERSALTVVADHFGITEIDPGANAGDLIRHDVMLGRTICLVMPRNEARGPGWCDFARLLGTAGRSAPLEDRVQLLIFAPCGLASMLTERESFLQPLWWWGVMDRLDTAVHVSDKMTSTRTDDVLRDAIVEVAGFDLALAEHLAAHWNGSSSNLAATLSDYEAENDNGWSKQPPPLPHTSTAWATPPDSVMGFWDEGLVDAWEPFPAYVHACLLSSNGRNSDLQSRIWRAQIRALMPLIDEERSRLVDWIRPQLAKGNDPLPKTPELVDLYLALQNHPELKSWGGGHRRRLIYWLRETRNTLAHMGTLEPADIAHGRKLIFDDRGRS